MNREPPIPMSLMHTVLIRKELDRSNMPSARLKGFQSDLKASWKDTFSRSHTDNLAR
jgi:hypothetical protein